MISTDKLAAGLIIMNVIIAAAVQLAIICVASVIDKKTRATQIAERAANISHCGKILASGWVDGHLHTANCCLPQGHHYDCATPVKALLFIGFQQPPF